MTTTETPPESVATSSSDQSGHWRAYPLGSVVLRFIIVLIPLGFASLVGLVVGSGIDGNSVGADTIRICLAGLVSLVTFVVTERVSRRLLPLAMLLKLSLVFPDRAPYRFSVALRSTSVKKLQQWAQDARVDDGPAALAEKVVTLATALNNHDRRTRGHSDRSRAMAELIATEMGLSDEEISEVRWGAFLHDIGKILVPAALLNKPGKPTNSEWETLKRHPGAGGELVEPLRAFLRSGVEAVSGHHENFDGSGYPKGLIGHEIALAARIVSVADSFEVMTAVRAYKKPMKSSEAREELARNSGTQFDPAVVRALLNVSLGKLHWTLGLAAWAAEVPFLTVIPRVAAQAGTFAVGPTITMGALSSVATISLGSVAPVALASPVHAPISSTSVTTASVLNQHNSAAGTTAESKMPGIVPDNGIVNSISPTASAPKPATNSASINASGSPSTVPPYSANERQGSAGSDTATSSQSQSQSSKPDVVATREITSTPTTTATSGPTKKPAAANKPAPPPTAAKKPVPPPPPAKKPAPAPAPAAAKKPAPPPAEANKPSPAAAPAQPDSSAAPAPAATKPAQAPAATKTPPSSTATPTTSTPAPPAPPAPTSLGSPAPTPVPAKPSPPVPPSSPAPATGNPHQPGATGNPHQPSQTGNPHG